MLYFVTEKFVFVYIIAYHEAVSNLSRTQPPYHVNVAKFYSDVTVMSWLLKKQMLCRRSQRGLNT